jgi:hypothetical protein
MAEPDDDREAVDRAFAELVAGYHLTADRPEQPRLALELTPELGTTDDPRTDPAEKTEPRVLPSWPEPPATPVRLNRQPVPPSRPPGPPPDERYVPDPLPPLARPGTLSLVGWTAVLFAAAVVLAAGFGLHLPAWLGWLAVTTFIVGSVVLLTQLPRHRPPDAGDGAVL